MIHDPTIEVTCDACGNSVKVRVDARAKVAQDFGAERPGVKNP